MRERMIRFMQGRYGAYGADRLSRFLMILGCALLLLTSFQAFHRIRLLPFLLLIYAYYRLLSRNIPRRYRENALYVRQADRVSSFFKNLRSGVSQSRTYHIYKCPSCRQKIRIPRGHGKIIVRCPKCRTEFMKRS